MGLPAYYRNSVSKTYTNSNMLLMHDNVYSMKIRHYQLIINNLLTFWIENWIGVNYKEISVKYLNINIPEFIPLSERKETDVEKGGKFINMFSQLQTTLDIKLKKEFVLNKLFPNDIISDMVEIDDGEVKDDIGSKETQEDIMSLFEENKNSNKNESVKLFDIIKAKAFNIIKYKLNLSIDW